MALNEFNKVDYYAEAVSRYTDQFQDKPVFDKYVQLLLNEKINVQTAMQQLMQLRSLDTATGKQLDIIGNIVGQERILVDTGLYIYFGWEEDPTAGSWADENVPSSGYQWVDENNANNQTSYVYIDDDTYRLFIRSKILKNISGVSPEEIIEFFNFLFGTTSTRLTELYPNTCIIGIGKKLSFQEKQFLNYSVQNSEYTDKLFPKPVGVSFQFLELQTPFFGFAGTAGAAGFGVGKLSGAI
jgi:hypothetical protein